MSLNIIIRREGRQRVVAATPGESLLEVINRDPAIAVTAPCGGKGRCGKCRVRVITGAPDGATDEERRILSESDIAAGLRLACRIQVAADMEVTIADNPATVQIQSGFPELVPPTDFEPVIIARFLQLEAPTTEYQQSDEDRIAAALSAGPNAASIAGASTKPRALGSPTVQSGEAPAMSMNMIRNVSSALREADFGVTVVDTPSGLCEILPGRMKEPVLGAAVDVGTTTVVLYLIDLGSGKVKAAASMLNPQGAFGADVITRIDYAGSSEEGLTILQSRVTAGISALLRSACAKAHEAEKQVYGFLFVGNTTMMHLLLRVPPLNIAAAPFIPAFLRGRTLPAAELNVGGNDRAVAITGPGISGYVGADIVAAILASGMTERSELCCLIDIGTNGEIVLGNRDSLVCCSTAAGPAFEGAQLRCGIGGVGGAISSVGLNDGEIELTTIANLPPAGICGSGITDILAILVASGIVDETGRFVDQDELERFPEALRKRVVDVDGQPAFSVCEGIVVTQKDVREIQLAKAAIAAGIRTLTAHEGIGADNLATLYLAGGFGSFIRKESAAAIGLIPAELVAKVEVIGNGAGKGAVMALTSRKHLAALDRIRGDARYIELSSSPGFQQAYIEEMMFPAGGAVSSRPTL